MEKKHKKEKAQRRDAVEFVCPSCNETKIIYIPSDEQIRCPHCKKMMVMRELLTEGKSC